MLSAITGLRLDDELNSAFQRGMDLLLLFFVRDRPVGLGQEKHAKSVTVHRPMQGVPRGMQETGYVLVLLADDIVDRLAENVSVGAFARFVPATEKRQSSQAGDGDVAMVRLGAPRAVRVLLRFQIAKASIDRCLGLLGDLLLRLFCVLGTDINQAATTKQRCQKRGNAIHVCSSIQRERETIMIVPTADWIVQQKIARSLFPLSARRHICEHSTETGTATEMRGGIIRKRVGRFADT